MSCLRSGTRSGFGRRHAGSAWRRPDGTAVVAMVIYSATSSSIVAAASVSASCGIALAEDHRLRPRIAERLPDLDRVGDVGHLDGAVRPARRRPRSRGWPRSTRGRCRRASVRIGICPVASRRAPSCSSLVANLSTSHAVAWFSHAVNMPIDFSSLNVWISSAGVPAASARAPRPSRCLRRRRRSPTVRRSPSPTSVGEWISGVYASGGDRPSS